MKANSKPIEVLARISAPSKIVHAPANSHLFSCDLRLGQVQLLPISKSMLCELCSRKSPPPFSQTLPPNLTSRDQAVIVAATFPFQLEAWMKRIRICVLVGVSW